MRNFIDVSINGVRQKIQGIDAFRTLSDFLRYEQGATGTKVVCAEGDCGACTVLTKNSNDDSFKSINSCIAFMWQLDGQEVVTVEGLKKNDQLHPAQTAMIQCQGTQCGYCTPGFICSMAQLAQDSKLENLPIDSKRAKNYLTGNLCRCTGYDSIIEASTKMDLSLLPDLRSGMEFKPSSVELEFDRQKIYLPNNLAEARTYLREVPRIVSGATDLGVLHNKGRWSPQVMMSLKNIPELSRIVKTKTEITIGATATLEQCSQQLEADFPEFSRLLRIFASPQIKNSATLVGNMMNASPIADSIPFLKSADARIHLLSPTAERVVDINEFFLEGYKKMALLPQEIVTHISLPLSGLSFILYKVSKRKDLDISAVTLAIGYARAGDQFTHFQLSLGGVAASVLRLKALESQMLNKILTEKDFVHLFNEIDPLITPQSDVRGSSDYRRLLVRNLLLKFFHEVVEGVV